MALHDILISFFCGYAGGLIMSSLFLRYMKNKRWLRISLTTKFYNDFSTEKCRADIVKKKNNLNHDNLLTSVLCVDDSPLIQLLNTRTINNNSFTKNTLIAKNGEEALSLLEGKSPDLIFLDLEMPVMDGWEFLENLNTNHYHNLKDTKIVILSSTLHNHDLERIKNYPMVIDYFPKPMTTQMIDSLKFKFHHEPQI